MGCGNVKAYGAGLTGLPVCKDAGVVTLEGVVQQTLPEALKHDVLSCKGRVKERVSLSGREAETHRCCTAALLHRSIPTEG